MDIKLINHNNDNKDYFNKRLKDFILNSFYYSYYNLSWTINFLIGFIIINFYKDYKLTSYYSYGSALFSIIVLSFSWGFSEIIGIKVSKKRGKNNILGCYKIIIKYFFILIFFMIIYLIIFFFIFKNLLIYININKNLINNSMKFIYYSIPYFILFEINKIIESFLISFEIKKYFLFSISLGYLVLIVSLLFGYYFFGFTLFLYPFGKLIQEICFFITNFYYFDNNFIKLKDLIKLFNINDLKKNLIKNMVFSFKILIGINFEILWFEINNLYLGFLNDELEISLWASFVNFMSLLYFFILGYSNSIRTEISYLIGKKKNHMAKSLFNYTIKIFSIIYFFFGLIFTIFSYYISSLYFSTENIKLKLSKLIKIYWIFIIFDLLTPFLLTISRINKKLNYIIFLNLVLGPISMIVFGYYLIIVKNYGAWGCLINFNLTQFQICIVLLIVYYFSKFNTNFN